MATPFEAFARSEIEIPENLLPIFVEKCKEYAAEFRTAWLSEDRGTLQSAVHVIRDMLFVLRESDAAELCGVIQQKLDAGEPLGQCGVHLSVLAGFLSDVDHRRKSLVG
ncbi:hypothetical protein [Dyella sp.]|uniref:hypothetical protein n=1 Tax=Dyella sp. TaxID=1869338 RepID=UPI002ED2C3F1